MSLQLFHKKKLLKELFSQKMKRNLKDKVSRFFLNIIEIKFLITFYRGMKKNLGDEVSRFSPNITEKKYF